MAEKVIHEMISAFAAGCMDKENYINFKDYIETGGELPHRELGEMQNLMAMIPLILELELPDVNLKDNVAKKLISLQGEIKAKIKEEKTRLTKEKELTTSKPTDNTITKAKVTKEFLTEAFEKNTESKPERKKVKDQKPAVISGQFSRWGLWIGFGLIIVLLTIAAFYFYNLNKSLSNDVSNLRTEITDLQDEISSNRDFIRDYDSLIEFFSYKDIVVVDLSPAGENSNASGKLFISYGQLKGLLELNGLQSLSPEETFQLWVVSRGVSYSLGVFKPTPQDRYFEIPQIPYISKEEMELARLTIEPLDGSDTPQGQTELFGIIVEKNPRRRR